VTSLWLKGEPEGKPTGVFVSTSSLHGGQETTILTLMASLLHLGMIPVGVPYSTQELFTTQGGGSPYGPGHVAGVFMTGAPGLKTLAGLLIRSV
jgi:NAD(P)H dehydrogenase (quinone)